MLGEPQAAGVRAGRQNWENVGWRVKVDFRQLEQTIRPKDHIELLRPLLPERYSPLQPNGNGLQSVYLTELPTPLAETLLGLIGEEVSTDRAGGAELVKPVAADDLELWERKLEQDSGQRSLDPGDGS